MKSTLLTLFAILGITACTTDNNNQMKNEMDISYPETRKDTTVKDDYHGTIVADPYRWLEDDRSEETMDWVDRQNEVTQKYLSKIPYRNAIRNRLEEIWNYEKYGTPFKENDQYYFFKNDGLQNQSVMYVQKDLESAPEVFLDPNSFSDKGTTSLGSFDFSNDGKYFAYTTSEGGSDWRTAYVRDLKSGELLEDEVKWIKFSGISFHKDGFYYSRYPEPKEGDKLDGKNENQKVYYHTIGTSQNEDKLIYEDPKHPNRGFGVSVTEDKSYLIMSGWESTSGNSLYFKSLVEAESDFVPLVETYDHDYTFLGHVNDRFYIMTNEGAGNNRVMEVDPSRPDRSEWREVIPESKNRLQGVSVIGGHFVLRYLKDASSKLIVTDYKGKKIRDVELPGIGTVGAFTGKKDEPECFYSFTSFNTPRTIYKYNVETGESTVFKKAELAFDPSQYETKQLWYESKDGTRVPMFVTHKKGLNMDGQRPTLLYGYGGFDISILPSFNVTRMIILENDGIYAVANIRGGGEFGSDWHKAGTKDQKQNVFDDFIAAGEHLINEGMTSADKLAIEGRSNGGLLVGACMTQRPDLYAVAFPGVGVLDMLRYHNFTIGRAWSSDYGLSETPDGFEYLVKYSPLHNVKDDSYPATMVTTADHDDRVVPAHSFKFAAALQEHQQSQDPVLIRIDKSAGHGAGKPTSMRIDESADLLSFMFFNMNEEISYQ